MIEILTHRRVRPRYGLLTDYTELVALGLFLGHDFLQRGAATHSRCVHALSRLGYEETSFSAKSSMHASERAIPCIPGRCPFGIVPDRDLVAAWQRGSECQERRADRLSRLVDLTRRASYRQKSRDPPSTRLS